MESNTPTVGGDEPKQEVLPTVAPLAESANGAASHLPAAPIPSAIADVADEVVADVTADVTDATTDVAADVAHELETPSVGDDSAPVASEGDMQTLLDQQVSEPQVKKGDILEGTIARTSPTEILVDVGLKSEGIISGKELERIDRETLGQLKAGEKLLVYVLVPEDRNGNVVLSLTRAMEEQDWRRAEELHQSGAIYSGKVDGYNKGGLIVRFGRLRGFVPESQVSRDRRRRAEGVDPQDKWGKMRGEDIAVKVLEVDRSRNRLILSEREAAPQIREQQKERLLTELKVGDRRRGRVKSLAEFGAFVDVGGADGLVHLTELSWKHVTHPKEILKPGQEVDVEVISVDTENKRIGLSIKRTEEDPWLVIARQYQIGQLVQGTITKLTKFGAFARLVDAPEIEGLIHISELAERRVNHPRDVVSEGEVLTLRVVKIDAEQRRMGLSIKRVDSPDYMEADYKRATNPDTPHEAPVGDFIDYEVATLKEDERRRNERRKGKKGGKKGKDDEFDEEFEDADTGEFE